MFDDEIELQNLNFKPLHFTFKYIDQYWNKNCYINKKIQHAYNDIGEL